MEDARDRPAAELRTTGTDAPNATNAGAGVDFTDGAGAIVGCPACGTTIRVTIEGASKVDRRAFERPSTRRLSRLDRDPDVAALARELDATCELTAIHAAVRDRFGEGRTPSRSALHRYLKRERSKGANTAD